MAGMCGRASVGVAEAGAYIAGIERALEDDVGSDVGAAGVLLERLAVGAIADEAQTHGAIPANEDVDGIEQDVLAFRWRELSNVENLEGRGIRAEGARREDLGIDAEAADLDLRPL